MIDTTHTKRRAAQALIGSLLFVTMVTLLGCGPIMSLLCSGQKQTDMDCSTDQTRAPSAP
jgi:uncharacterized protein YceK